MDNDKKSNESNSEPPEKLKRIDGQYIFREIADVFCAKSGLFYTIKKMLISPGKSVRQYLEEDRKPFVRPIVFVIVTSLIYAFVDFFFSLSVFEQLRTEHPDISFFTTPFVIIALPDSFSFLRWLTGSSAYTTLLLGVFVAFAARILFRKSGYNFFEILVLLCYVCGISMLFLSVSVVLSHLSDFSIMGGPGALILGIMLSMIYLVWAVGQFFEKNQHGVVKKIMLYVKAFLCFCIGQSVYVALIRIIIISHR